MPETKIFYKVNDEEYDTFQAWVSDPSRAHIPEGGIVGKIGRFFAPDKQRVNKYSAKITHLVNSNDNICEFGIYPNPAFGFTEYTLTEAIVNGYISNDDPSVL